jgi:hypothetical protein
MNHKSMYFRQRIAVACVLAIAWAAGAEAQENSPAADVASASMRFWEFIQPIPLDKTGESPWSDFVLTPEVFDAARLDLADLRLYDAAGNEVPYSCRELRTKDAMIEATSKPFNESQGADGSSQVSLDLGEATIEHNEVQIQTPGLGFRRRAVVEGSDDGEQWSKLADKPLLNFRDGDRSLTVDVVEYSSCRFRYVRLTVHQDPQVDHAPVEIESAIVRRRIQVPGEDVTRTVPFGEREATRTDQGPGSRWTIDLGGRNVPCERLIVKVDDPEFARDYYIEAGGPAGSRESFWRIADGTWQRRAGDSGQDMVATFQEVKAARLRLYVTDHSNPPLTISSVQVAAPARQVVFARPADLPGPLTLYFGYPKAEAPKYDFARNLPETLKPAPSRLTAGARARNPAFEPEPLPLTERLPWLIYVVLGGAVAVLGLLIANLARAAIQVSDARAPVPTS